MLALLWTAFFHSRVNDIFEYRSDKPIYRITIFGFDNRQHQHSSITATVTATQRSIAHDKYIIYIPFSCFR